MFPSAKRRTSRSAREADGSIRIAIRIGTVSVLVAIVRDVRPAGASHRVRVRVRAARGSAGSVVLAVRAAAAARSDSVRAIDQRRAVAAVVPVPVRAKGKVRAAVLAPAAVESAADSFRSPWTLVLRSMSVLCPWSVPGPGSPVQAPDADQGRRTMDGLSTKH